MIIRVLFSLPSTVFLFIFSVVADVGSINQNTPKGRRRRSIRFRQFTQYPIAKASSIHVGSNRALPYISQQWPVCFLFDDRTRGKATANELSEKNLVRSITFGLGNGPSASSTPRVLSAFSLCGVSKRRMCIRRVHGEKNGPNLD